MARRKPDFYLEYINLINNPSMHPKYFTEAIKYQASSKKACEKFLRNSGNSKNILKDIQCRNHSRGLNENRSAHRVNNFFYDYNALYISHCLLMVNFIFLFECFKFFLF